MAKRIRQCDPEKQSHWEEVMRRWGESGQSVREYCRAAGLQESAFYFWRRELARRRVMGTIAEIPHNNRAMSDLDPRGNRVASAATEPWPSSAVSTTTAARRPSTTQAVRASSRQEQTSLSPRAKPLFLPVAMVHDAHPPAASDVEIVIGSRTVRVRPGFDRQTLVDVLAVLEMRPC